MAFLQLMTIVTSEKLEFQAEVQFQIYNADNGALRCQVEVKMWLLRQTLYFHYKLLDEVKLNTTCLLLCLLCPIEDCIKHLPKGVAMNRLTQAIGAFCNLGDMAQVLPSLNRIGLISLSLHHHYQILQICSIYLFSSEPVVGDSMIWRNMLTLAISALWVVKMELQRITE